ncbi:MAG: GGDEF domain-containing protein [Anaerolineales bacterium]
MKSRKFILYTSLLYLENQSRPKLVVLSILLVLLLGAIDYLTGFELTFSLFYLLPVSIVSWGVGRRAGLLIAALSVLIWSISNLLTGEMFSSPFIIAWNTVTRLLILVIMSLLLNALRRVLDEERRHARIDPLTGALNRRAFYELVNTRILFARPAPPCTLVYLDLDNFKVVNDTFGHNTGDVLLVTVVDTIARHIGPQDAIARLGGDEFIILLMETEPQPLAETVTRLQYELLAAMRAQDWPVTFSIGVLTFLQPAASVGQMITLADRLMYRVKSAAKDGVIYDVFPPSSPPASVPHQV